MGVVVGHRRRHEREERRELHAHVEDEPERQAFHRVRRRLAGLGRGAAVDPDAADEVPDAPEDVRDDHGEDPRAPTRRREPAVEGREEADEAVAGEGDHPLEGEPRRGRRGAGGRERGGGRRRRATPRRPRPRPPP